MSDDLKEKFECTLENLEKKIKLLEREVELLEQLNNLFNLIDSKKEKQNIGYVPPVIMPPPYPPYYPLVTYTTTSAKLQKENSEE